LIRAGPRTLVNPTWLFRTANHKAIDVVKLRIRVAKETPAPTEDLSSPSSADPSLLHLLRARAARLPKKLHDFYVLRYEEGLSQREIAKRLGLCRGSVRCLDRRCLRIMKGRLTV
jgi:DNA-directed RNA polymerase specialized sigma24 family protein